MNKSAKHNKKEEQKKLAVRIICLVLVVALLVTSLLAMFPTLFQSSESQGYTIEDLLEMGLIEMDEAGNIYFVDEALETERHEGHDHE